MSNLAKFIIAALLIFGGMMAYKNYKEGGFAHVKGIDVPVEKATDSAN